MTIAHIWMFSAYCAWMDCVTGAWMRPPRARKTGSK